MDNPMPAPRTTRYGGAAAVASLVHLRHQQERNLHQRHPDKEDLVAARSGDRTPVQSAINRADHHRQRAQTDAVMTRRHVPQIDRYEVSAPSITPNPTTKDRTQHGKYWAAKQPGRQDGRSGAAPSSHTKGQRHCGPDQQPGNGR